MNFNNKKGADILLRLLADSEAKRCEVRGIRSLPGGINKPDVICLFKIPEIVIQLIIEIQTIICPEIIINI